MTSTTAATRSFIIVVFYRFFFRIFNRDEGCVSIVTSTTEIITTTTRIFTVRALCVPNQDDRPNITSATTATRSFNHYCIMGLCLGWHGRCLIGRASSSSSSSTFVFFHLFPCCDCYCCCCRSFCQSRCLLLLFFFFSSMVVFNRIIDSNSDEREESKDYNCSVGLII